MCKTCSVEGCNNKIHRRGYCNKHYLQIRRHGKIFERTRRDSNEIIEYDDYAEIVLYNKDCEEVARTIIDLDDIDKVKDFKWYLNDNGYVLCNNPKTRLHRLIMNPSDGMVVDHINRNRVDNRKSNLRICTNQQNSVNVNVSRNNTSGTTGVNYDKRSSKWQAYININGERKHLGYYDSKEDAIAARRQAEIDYFGEFAPNNNQE